MRERGNRRLLRPARMCRVEAIVRDRDVREVLTQLGAWGQAQLIRTAPGPDSAPFPPDDKRDEIERCDGFIARAGRLRSLLGIASPADEDPADRPFPELEADLSHWEQESSRIVADRERLVTRKEALNAAAASARPCLEAGLPPESIATSEYLHIVIGSIPARSAIERDDFRAFVIVPLETGDGTQRIIAVSSRSRAAQLDEALASAGFKGEPVPDTGSAGLNAWVRDNEAQRQAAESELEQNRKQLDELSVACAGPLAAAEARARLDRSLLEAQSAFCRTASTTLIVAWTPASAVPELQALLRETTQGIFLLGTSEAGSGRDEAPVLLRHSSWIQPYSMLMEAYGTPQYTEIEPTVFMAVSYVLMFGVMFGDVGHGAVLVIAGLAARWLGQGLLRDAGAVLVFAGGSSSVFGALYGSCFGIHALQKYALWRDPIAGDPMDIMVACIGFGICLISLGIVLNVVNLLRRRDWIGALLDKFGVAGLLFYWGVVGVLAGYEKIAASGMEGYAFAVLALTVLAWMLKKPMVWILARRRSEPLDSSIGAELAESAAEAFEAMLVYLANTISFVRLAAYAMSHAALLLAIFLVSAEVRTIPGGATAVAVVGNAVVIVLEATVAAVQALRLEYYEFFGKFFSGSGQPFTPFHIPGHGRRAAHAQRS